MESRNVLALRLSALERARLAAAAVLRGLGVSSYIREVALEAAERELARKPASEADPDSLADGFVASSGSFSRRDQAEGSRVRSDPESPPASSDNDDLTARDKIGLRRGRAALSRKRTPPAKPDNASDKDSVPWWELERQGYAVGHGLTADQYLARGGGFGAPGGTMRDLDLRDDELYVVDVDELYAARDEGEGGDASD